MKGILLRVFITTGGVSLLIFIVSFLYSIGWGSGIPGTVSEVSFKYFCCWVVVLFALRECEKD